jgi:single-stranded-DNA-specific exonuclease
VRDAERALRLLHAVDAVVPHTDADGLAAGALALRARRQGAADAILLARGETPFGADPPLPRGSFAVLDWGVRRLERPGLLVDHHAPEAEPRADQVILSSYGEQPETPTAPLVRRLVPEEPAWLAAVGAVGDLGDGAFRLPECHGAPRDAVRRLVPLVNAARRVVAGPVREALALLIESDTPAAALADPRCELLEEARAEWRDEFERVRRTPPRVFTTFALVRFSSPAQVHPLVATQWQRRLAPRAVIAANDDYLPGRVNFAVRGGTVDLRRWLRDALPEAQGEFAHGHARATGGSLTPADFALLLERLDSVRRESRMMTPH